MCMMPSEDFFSPYLQKIYLFSRFFPTLYHVFLTGSMLNFFLLYTIILVKESEFDDLSRHFDTIRAVSNFIQFSICRNGQFLHLR